ncbi:MAG: leucine--tRNA ligase [Candidatus Saccharimonadales bacterium]
MKRYNPKEIEPKWQAKWEVDKIYEASDDPSKPKRYILEYFPYPSGAAMHVGHVRNYTIGDAIARFSRMKGFNVLHPMGWDAFGLPAENYAIKTGISPQQAIAENTGQFKQQLMQMGFSYDWSREFASSDPDYYKWTQWFFLLLHKRGLAYQKESLQWWCPVDKTVLANEQVENGRCWRCGSEVEKKALKQWFFKITDYADRLAKDLDDVDWSDSIKAMQRNWIGRSTGAEITFAVDGSDEKLTVFTTRADTLFGATFMVLAPEHPLLEKIVPAEHKQQVENYQAKARAKSDIERQETDREKTGVFSGAYAVNPVNGEKLPIWVADYVLMGYGTGAIMAVPAHDERDFAFAEAFGLKTVSVIDPVSGEKQGDEAEKDAIVAIVRNPKDGKILMLDWGPRMGRWGGHLFIGGGLDPDEDVIECAKREIAEETGYINVKHVSTTDFTAHSYYFSNVKDKNYYARIKGLLFDLVDNSQEETNLDAGEQNKFTPVWVDEVEADRLVDDGSHRYVFESLVQGKSYHGEGLLVNSDKYDGLATWEAREKIVADLNKKGLGQEKVNYKMRDWLISRQRYWGAPIPMIHCEKDGIVPVPEDQLPVVLPEVKSYEPSGDGRSPLANVPEFVNTTCPKCGGPATRETDTMDGFACSSWYFLRFADPHNKDKAFDTEKAKFWLPVDDYIGGAEHAVMHLLYARMWTKVMQDEGLIDFGEPFKKLRNQGMILAPDGQKMSKSKGNVIAPDELINQGYGADSTRIMELFIGPWNQSAAWSVEGMGGSFRFLQRVWTLVQEWLETQAVQNSNEATEIKRVINRTIKKVGEDLESLSFNTAVAAMMECVNELYKQKASVPYAEAHDSWKSALESLVQLLAPFAPHIAEELWQQLGNEASVHTSAWPTYNEKYLVSDSMTIVVQVNGKLRDQIVVPVSSDEATIVAAAKEQEKVVAQLASGQIAKTIYVPGKLVNFVIK